MKRLVMATWLAGILVSPAAAVEVWQGDLFVTAATAACAQAGVGVNDFFRAVYRPRNVEDNGQDTRLSLFASRSAHRIVVGNGALAGTGNYTGLQLASTTGVETYNGVFAGAAVTPASPTPNTQTVVVRVTLRTFTGEAGCNATLQGSLGNRPNL
jgi:hypothetical protein